SGCSRSSSRTARRCARSRSSSSRRSPTSSRRSSGSSPRPPRPRHPHPILYTWTALYAYYFFPLREAAAQMVFLGASYAIVLAAEDADMVVVRWLLAVGTPLVAGLLISQL